MSLHVPSLVRPAVLFPGLLAALAVLFSFWSDGDFRDSEWAQTLSPLTSRMAEISPQWLNSLLGLDEEDDEFEIPSTLGTFKCLGSNYTTEIVSIDPLLIYINNFISPEESLELLRLGNSSFRPSRVDRFGRKENAQSRTSESAALPRTHPVTSCILARAKSFMGTMVGGDDDFSAPQLVRYARGQKFDLHSDWYERPQLVDVERKGSDGKTAVVEKSWNRISSFFVFVKSNCRGGETYFPYINKSNLHGLDPISAELASQAETEQKGKAGKGKEMEAKMREHEKGGLAFKPIEGNALFWINLMPDGRGDRRVLHAGLPLDSGSKVGMNIWPRKFYAS